MGKNQAEREVENAKYNMNVAELDLLKLEKGDGPLEIARLESVVLKAKQEYEAKKGYIKDLKVLKKRGYANPTEIDQARNKTEEGKQVYDTAKRQYESYRDHVLPSLIKKARAHVAKARMDLEQTKKGVGFQIGKALAALRQAKEGLKNSKTLLRIAEADLERTVIRAPIPGMVVIRKEFRGKEQRKPRVGDVVWQKQAIIYLPDLSKMVVETLIREIDLHKVAIGKLVAVYVDAFPDLRLSGNVESIGVLAESRKEVNSAEKYFQVVISVSEEEERLDLV